MYELSNELPNDLRLTIFRKLGNLKKILLTIETEEKYPVGHPKIKFKQSC